MASAKESVHLYLDETTLKLARATTVAGKRIIAGLYYKDVAGVSDLNLSVEIQQGMKALAAKTHQIEVLLASKFVITKTIEVPSLDPKEIQDIVRLQAIRHTPYSKEEVVIGHMNLDIVLERYTKTLLTIASNQNVRKRTDAVELAGYEVGSVHLAPEGLAKQIVTLLGLTKDTSNIGVIYLDQTFTDILFLSKLKPAYIRSVPLGSKNLATDMEQISKQLIEELKKTTEAFQSEDPNSVPKRFLMVGVDSPEQKTILKRFEEELKIRFDSPITELQFPLTEEAKKNLVLYKSVSFLDVISDALSEGPAAIDLIPEDLVLRRSFNAKGQEIFMAGVIFMILFILVMGIFLSKIYFRKSYLSTIQKNFEIKQKEADELIRISEESRVIKDFQNRKGEALKVLNELQQVLPSEMYLSEMSFTPDEKLSIKGTSERMSAVFAFVTEFEGQPLFKSVNPDYTKSRKENDKDVSDFGISAEIDKEADKAVSQAAKPVAKVEESIEPVLQSEVPSGGRT